MKSLLNSALALCLLVACQAQKEKIGLNLSKNETYTQKTRSNISIHQTINGQPIDMLMAVNGTMTYKVTDIRDSLYIMEVRYQSLVLTMTLPNGTMEFSSEKNDKNDILSTILGMVKDKPFDVKMTKTGRIAEVRNIESLFANVFEQFPQIPAVQKQQIQNQLMQAYGEKAFKGSIEMVTAVFPDTKVAKGDKWVINTQLESGFSANVKTTYELKEITDSYYVISGNSTIETADKDAYVQSNGMPLKYDMAGTTVSGIKTDRTSGWIIEADIIQNLSGKAQIKDNPQAPGGMTIPMTMKTEMTVTK